jgi:Homeobox KN domain
MQDGSPTNLTSGTSNMDVDLPDFVHSPLGNDIAAQWTTEDNSVDYLLDLGLESEGFIESPVFVSHSDLTQATSQPIANRPLLDPFPYVASLSAHRQSSTSQAQSAQNMIANGPAVDETHSPLVSTPAVMSQPQLRRVRSQPLPKASVCVLEEWLDSNLEYPYPTKDEKIDLVNRSGLGLTQVCNWFTNARSRNPKLQSLVKTRHEPIEPSTPVSVAGTDDEPAVSQEPGIEIGTIDLKLLPPTTTNDLIADHPRRGRKRRFSDSITIHATKRSRSSSTDSHRSEKGSDATFQCTFCHIQISSKSWRRHEEETHFPQRYWTCMRSGALVERDGGQFCTFCGDATAKGACLKDHQTSVCVEKPEEQRRFFRKQHLAQHLKNSHGVAPLREEVASAWSTKIECPNYVWECGFCREKLQTWDVRQHHLARHFREGKRMDSWAASINPSGIACATKLEEPISEDAIDHTRIPSPLKIEPASQADVLKTSTTTERLHEHLLPYREEGFQCPGLNFFDPHSENEGSFVALDGVSELIFNGFGITDRTRQWLPAWYCGKHDCWVFRIYGVQFDFWMGIRCSLIQNVRMESRHHTSALPLRILARHHQLVVTVRGWPFFYFLSSSGSTIKNLIRGKSKYSFNEYRFSFDSEAALEVAATQISLIGWRQPGLVPVDLLLRFKCRLCPLTFNSLDALKSHEELHQEANTSVFGETRVRLGSGESFDSTLRLGPLSVRSANPAERESTQSVVTDPLRGIFNDSASVERIPEYCRAYVCGERCALTSGSSWGCQRFFRGIHRLAWHLLSKEGAICIAPLVALTAESMELEQRLPTTVTGGEHYDAHDPTSCAPQSSPMQTDTGSYSGGEYTSISPDWLFRSRDSAQGATGNLKFPPILLTKYPALSTVNWDAISSLDGRDEGFSFRPPRTLSTIISRATATHSASISSFARESPSAPRSQRMSTPEEAAHASKTTLGIARNSMDEREGECHADNIDMADVGSITIEYGFNKVPGGDKASDVRSQLDLLQIGDHLANQVLIADWEEPDGRELDREELDGRESDELEIDEE